MRNILRTVRAALAVTFVTAMVQASAQAHFIWATVENGQVRFALLEDANEAPNAQFEKYVANLSPRCGGKALTLGAPQSGARTASLPAGQNVVTANTIVRAKEAEDGNYLLVYHAKGAASLAAAATATEEPAEIRARRDGGNLVVTVHQDKWPAPNTEVWVHLPGVETPTSITTDLKGEARLAWSEKTAGGFVGLRAKLIEPKSGVHEGIKYTTVHRWATLTFPVAGPKPQQKASAATAASAKGEEKPFTKILRESYGANHEVVGNAAFNQTLFAGKLTRPQLEAHLQQRALIHNEVHRILNAAGTQVPYGAEQKRVLVLLFEDLIGMGSGWPTEAQARPLTETFLQEIRESEKRGPYFALGVHHVYYGGITNGGRMIGEKIGETLGVVPTYYAKSDGYFAYLAEVNKISDPNARQEMIRGGQAAYRYIIESSNEDIFKTNSLASGAK
ncbi:MAG: hypothetical protein OHK0029_41930 [Armatimonadaceae bacterium]